MARFDCIAVYIVTNLARRPLYTGVTSDLIKRMYQHRTGETPGFATRYNCRQLVWWEAHEAMESAILREKRIKRWQRVWKVELIEASNPTWSDLSIEFLGPSRAFTAI